MKIPTWLTVTFLMLFGQGHALADALDDLSALQIRRFSPKATEELVQALIENKSILRAAGITTRLRIAHLLSQFAVETGGLVRIDENLSYTTVGAVNRAFSFIDRSEAQTLLRKPRDLANRAYSNRLGNGNAASNDGYNYRGSGFIQLTGRFNFAKHGAKINMDLIGHPDLARMPKEGLIAGVSYWARQQVNDPSDRDDARQVRVRINGKRALGLAEAKLWLRRGKIALKVEESGGMDIAAVDYVAVAEALVERDLMQRPKGLESGVVGPRATTAALEKFQEQNELEVTGVLDLPTLYKLTDTWRPQDQSATESDAPKSLGGTVYRVADELVSHVTPLSEPPKRSASAQEGGIMEGSRLSELEADRIAKGVAFYPDYETGTVAGAPSDGFVPFSVIEPDTRHVVEDTTVGRYRAVVQIAFKDPSDGIDYNCSGTIIDKNIVLTAGHCVHSGGINGNWFSDFAIFPARKGPVLPFGKCEVEELFALDEWVYEASDQIRGSFDLGAIKLKCDIGKQTGWVELKSTVPAIGQNTEIVGYPCDLIEGMPYVSSDTVTGIASGKLYYQNDTFGCMSGGPVFQGDNNTLLGVHTSGLFGIGLSASNNSGTIVTNEMVNILSAWLSQ